MRRLVGSNTSSLTSAPVLLPPSSGSFEVMPTFVMPGMAWRRSTNSYQKRRQQRGAQGEGQRPCIEDNGGLSRSGDRCDHPQDVHTAPSQAEAEDRSGAGEEQTLRQGEAHEIAARSTKRVTHAEFALTP